MKNKLSKVPKCGILLISLVNVRENGFLLARSKFSGLGKTANCHGLAINPSIRLLCRNFISRSFHEILFSEQRKIDFFPKITSWLIMKFPNPFNRFFIACLYNHYFEGWQFPTTFSPEILISSAVYDGAKLRTRPVVCRQVYHFFVP